MAATAGIGAFIGGALGTFIGGPIGTAVGSLAGGMVGDWAGDALFDVIFGDQYARQGEIKDIQQEPKYSASVDRNTIVIQPIVTG
jgi:phage tail tape-measure protein